MPGAPTDIAESVLLQVLTAPLAPGGADDGLLAAVPGGWHVGSAPPSVKVFPLGIITNQDPQLNADTTTEGELVMWPLVYGVRVVTRGRSHVAGATLARKVYARLARLTGVTAYGLVSGVAVQGAIQFPERDGAGDFQHTGHVWRVWVEEAP